MNHLLRHYRIVANVESGPVVASVVWRAEKLDVIVVVRRTDGFSARLEVPSDIRRDLKSLDRDAVGRNGVRLKQAVLWALPDLDFEFDESLGAPGLNNGVTPAECGAIRRFGPQVYGVDVGEFEMPERRWAN